MNVIALSFNDLPVWAWILILLTAALATAWAAKRILIGTLRKLTSRTRTNVDDIVLHGIGPSLTIVFFVAGAWMGLRLIPVVFSSFTQDVIDNLGFLLIALAVALALTRLFSGFMGLAIRREPRWQPVVTVGSRAFSLVIYLLAFAMILGHAGVEITPLLASLGIVGIAVALALQDTLSNFFAGLWIQAGRTLTQGHLVEFDDPQIIGFVREVGWRTTKIHTLPNNVVVIPNLKVAQATVTDYDLPEPRMGSNLLVRVGYESNAEDVERILLDSVYAVAKNKPEVGILAEPAPSTRLNGFLDHGYEFWLGFQCKDWFAQHAGGGEIRKEIVRRFQEAGIRIPYPIQEHVTVPAGRADFVPGGLAAGRYATAPEEASGSQA